MAKKTLEQKRDAEVELINIECDNEIKAVADKYSKKIIRRDKKNAKAAFTDAND